MLNVNFGRDYKGNKTGNIPVYGTGGLMLKINHSLSDEDAVGIGRKGTINHPFFLKAPFWTVDTLFYVTNKNNMDVRFILFLFENINWKKYDESTGVPSLSKQTINNINRYVPRLLEQKSISSLLTRVNKLIAANQRNHWVFAINSYLR